MGRVAGAIGFISILAVIFTATMIAISLQKLNSDEMGLAYDMVQRSLSDSPSFEGLHSGPPGFTFIKFPNVYFTLQFNNVQCLNRDGVQTWLSIGYQYRVRPNDLHKVVVQFRTHEHFQDILKAMGESAIHEACSQFSTAQFQSDRGAFQEDIRERLVRNYDAISTDVTDLQINEIIRPQAYETVIKQKERAREDIEVAENERPQKLTEAETVKLQAETEAAITLDKADSEVKIIASRAEAEAQAIVHEYSEETASYKLLKTKLGLDNPGFLSYIGIRTVEDSKSNVYVNVKAPAKSSWVMP